MAKHVNSTVTIGEYTLSRVSFPGLDTAFTHFSSPEFSAKTPRQKYRVVSETLCQLIKDLPSESFGLPAVVEFIDRLNAAHLLQEPYNLLQFESWLNLYSELSYLENLMIRAKIAGRHIPREDYQIYFPIGMNKTFLGSHFVCAHLSPDVDTMVASFWGWLDAFATRVGDSRHIWSLPGGPPDSPVSKLFQQYFGAGIFEVVARKATTLSLTALDVITTKGFVKKRGDVSLSALDPIKERAVILVDDEGHYIGDWHTSDIEPIRKIIIRFKSCLRWFENNLHVKLISLFSKETLNKKDVAPFLSSVFDVKIADCEPAKEFTERQKVDLHDFFEKVIGLKNGLMSTYRELNHALSELSMSKLSEFQTFVMALENSEIFDSFGNLIENRPAIFYTLEKIIHELDGAIQYARDYVEQLDVALKIKKRVFEIPAQYVTIHNDIEDVRLKMQQQEYLTVVVSDGPGKLFPLGVIWANQIQQQALGTVSFRDFCNSEEVKMASYLIPISVVDHHKMSLKTSAPPIALVGDAQSCNVLLAEQEFILNTPYALGGMTKESIEKKIEFLRKEDVSIEGLRNLQSLIQKKAAAELRKEYFVHPDREIAEYFCFLHAILDDTDLLTKVSKRDVKCIAELLNRVKSLIAKDQVEVLTLDNIPNDKHFTKLAAQSILQNPEMFSFYSQIYNSKEQEIEAVLNACEDSKYETAFLDTKEQNGCCRVGQTKLFTQNFPSYQKNDSKLLNFWVKRAEAVYQASPEIDLHLHMISTIPSAKEVYTNKVGHYLHQDELWFWVPSTQIAYDHLTTFLIGFLEGVQLGKNVSLQFLPAVEHNLQQVFLRNCPNISLYTGVEKQDLSLPVVILRFSAGVLNSRKAMITPYLPRLLS